MTVTLNTRDVFVSLFQGTIAGLILAFGTHDRSAFLMGGLVAGLAVSSFVRAFES